MKVWLDDMLDSRDSSDRHTPLGWIGVKTALQACRLIKTGKVEAISLDHDLGVNSSGTEMCSGYVVAKYIEKMAFLNKIPRIESCEVHSANPVGKTKMVSALANASKFWDSNEYLASDTIIQEMNKMIIAAKRSK
ncbi:cyclic-phosphate processing receiver domain-containing protein [Flavobacterium sp.]|uniref:cyclic-phosphate processing receiver domain-containing protein n=1 Tax=Flavobacterium sp. TaxID=239 RepID=UPI00326383A8